MTRSGDYALLRKLIARLRERELTAAEKLQFKEILLQDAEARRIYARYAVLRGLLELDAVDGPDRDTVESPAAPKTRVPPLERLRNGSRGAAAPASWKSAPASVNPALSKSPVLRFLAALNGKHSVTRLAGLPMSTALAWTVMLLCACGVVLTFAFVALLIRGVSVHVDGPGLEIAKQPPQNSVVPLNRDSERRPSAGPSATAPPTATVARLIHAYDCRWAAGTRAPHAGDDLEPGRKLELRSGLAEIMFQSGVRTLLQGPATLEIGSRSNTTLNFGKLTVRVEDPDARGFVVHAPGMKYTDLGTEFAVWVTRDGKQEVHVFRGQVRVEESADRPAAPGRIADQEPEHSNANAQRARARLEPFVLNAQQAIRIAPPGYSNPAQKPIERISANEKRFCRLMPEAEPFPIFSTGVGLDRGASDPHWEVTRNSMDANFKPRPAVVVRPVGYYLADKRDQFQWISLVDPKNKDGNTLSDMPSGCRLTFRTHFDLSDFDASTARIEGRLTADDYVAEIRLNGKPLPVPAGARQSFLFQRWLGLKIDNGFAAGDNTLEIVIENGYSGVVPDFMALNVDCKGTARPKLKPAEED